MGGARPILDGLYQFTDPRLEAGQFPQLQQPGERDIRCPDPGAHRRSGIGHRLGERTRCGAAKADQHPAEIVDGPRFRRLDRLTEEGLVQPTLELSPGQTPTSLAAAVTSPVVSNASTALRCFRVSSRSGVIFCDMT